MTIYLLSTFLTIFGILTLGWCQVEEDALLHFSDPQQGKVVWIVDDTSVPWIGSYQYLSSASSAQTVLLTVVDSSTGATLGECIMPSGNDSTRRWERFTWELNLNGLQCTYSNGNPNRALFPATTNPRTFSVRIQAARGPVCMRDMQVQSEVPLGCPPHLSRNSFTSMFFNCSCPYEDDVIDESDFESTGGSLDSTPQFPLFQGIGVGSTPAASSWTLSPSPCASHECFNNGTCLVSQEGAATCLCRNGFTGTKCELDLCSSVPCQNGGVCRSNAGIAYCECKAGFSGLLCESTGEEDGIHCNPECSNGQCIVRNGVASCECRQGFTGKNCNVLDVCLGDAACAMFGSQAKCVLDDEMENLSSPALINATYDCHCPHPINGQYVDCLELHVPSTTVAVTTHTPTFPVLEISQLPVTAPTPAPTSEEVEETTEISTVGVESNKSQENVQLERITLPPPFAGHTVQTETSTTQHVPQTWPSQFPDLTHTQTLHPVITNSNTQRPPTTFIFPQTPQTTVPTPSTTVTPQTEIVPKFVSPQQPQPTIEQSEEMVEEEHETENGTSQETEDSFPTPSTMQGIPSHFTSQTPFVPSTLPTTAAPTTTETEEYEETTDEEEPATDPTTIVTVPPVVVTTTEESVEESAEETPSTQATLPFWMTSSVAPPQPSLPPSTPFPMQPSTIVPMQPMQPVFSSTPEPETSDEFVEETPESREIEPSSVTEATTNESKIAENVPTNTGKQSSAAASWIIAIFALIVLGLLLLMTSVFVMRYIRQSRKLHGKYNPAREEHALSAAYAMPMSHIAKEERLI